MADVRVLYDLVSWETENSQGGVDHHRARYGEVVSVSDEQAERWQSLDPPAAVSADDVSREGLESIRGDLGDDAVKNLSVAETIAYVNQHPEQARRVFALEREGRGDSSVLAATGLDLDEETDDGNPAVFPRAGVETVSDPQQKGADEESQSKRRSRKAD